MKFFAKPFVLCSLTLLMIGIPFFASATITETSSSGNWNNVTTWTNGIPPSHYIANINHALTLDKNIDISEGYYTVNASVTDNSGGTAYSLTITGAATYGTLELKANMTFEGSCYVMAKGQIIIHSGDTLRLGYTVFDEGSFLTIEEGGVLIVNGNLENKNNSTGITVNGTMIVNGNFLGEHGSQINGSGNFSTTGSMTGAGSIFGISPLNCNGPCNGRSLVGFTNTISSSQTICSGQTPASLTGFTDISNPSYQWQKSTDNSTYSNISGSTSLSYSPGALTVSTWFRRIVSHSGISSTSAAVKITISTSGLWTGAVSSNWSVAGNWCGGYVPLATDNVNINSGSLNMPVIPSGSFTCNNLTISLGTSLTLSSGSILTINGNLINSGTYSDNGGTLIFNGSTPQNITGIHSLNHLTVNNPYSITISNALTIHGIVNLINGTLTSNGLVTINLDAGGIAYHNTDAGTIFGNITLKRSITSAQYHYLSAPLSGQTVADWHDNLPVTGYTYYHYDETNPSTDYMNGWTGITSSSTPLVQMKGHALYFTDTTIIDNTGSYTHGTNPISISLTHTHTGTNGADGWNLVGNPYPSAIDWDASSGWTKTNVYNAIYCWDPIHSRYTYYTTGTGVNGGTRYIAPMQGFWVRVDTTKTSGTLQTTSHVRTTSSSTFYKKAASNNPLLRLNVTSDNYEDETVLRFMEEATENFDGEFDAYKMMNEGEHPSLYTLIGGAPYAINSIDHPEGEIEIPLILKVNKTGIYKISAKEILSFDPSYSIILEDNRLHVSQDLNENSEYEFIADDPNRLILFTIRIKRATATSTSSAMELHDVKMTLQNQLLYVRNLDNSGDASIAIYSTHGTEMGRSENISFHSGEFTYDMSTYHSGMYIVNVLVHKKSYSQKIFLH